MLYQSKNAPVFLLYSLREKVSLITGGSRGIGLAAAIGLAEAGSNIAITYNSSNSQHMSEVEKIFTAIGIKYKAYKCNVEEREQIFKCIEDVVADFRRLDVVVPNAGVGSYSKVEEYSKKAIEV